MSLGPASPFFVTANLKRAVQHYTQRLGFELRHSAPADQPFFAIVGLGAAQIMLKEIGPKTPPQPNSTRHPDARWDAFIYTPDPDALTRGLGAQAALDDDGLYGLTQTDADGYVLFFGRPA